MFLKKYSSYSPVCVRICLFNKDGLSNAFPQTSHGSRALSDFVAFLWILGVMSNSSLDDPADDDARESPDTDLCSSSGPDGGDIGRSTLDNSDVDKSNGESVKEDKCEDLIAEMIFNTTL